MKKFGKYLLERQLAIGGMAEVFLARQHGPAGFEKTLVIKRILPHFANDEAFITMFLDEARTSAKLNHPNLVQIYELGEIEGSYYIAMEYIRGQSLAKVTKKLRKMGVHMPLHLAAKIVASTCAGLDYAHNFAGADGESLNLVHRDISPDNVLVSYDGAVKMIDFGIAKARTSESKTQAGAVKGKFSYMSPEQIQGRRLDRRSDIFSLGIVLHELTTLSKPFGEGADLMTVTAIVNDPPVAAESLIEGYPPALWDIISKALSKKPGSRYESAHEMQIALERFIHSRGEFLSDRDIGSYLKKLFSDDPDHILELREMASGIRSRVLVPPASHTTNPGGADHSMNEDATLIGAVPDDSAPTMVAEAPSERQLAAAEGDDRTIVSDSPGETIALAKPQIPAEDEKTRLRTAVVDQGRGGATEDGGDKKSGGGGKWIALLLIVALLGGGGFFAWQQWGQGSKKSKDGSDGGTTEVAGDTGNTSGQDGGEATGGESATGEPTGGETTGGETTAADEPDAGSVLAEEDAGAPVAEEDAGAPVAEEDAGAPVAEEDAGSAVAEEDAGSAVAEEDAGSVVAEEDAGSVVAEEDAGPVAAEEDAGEALTEDTGSPVAVEDTGQPAIVEDAGVAVSPEDTGVVEATPDTGQPEATVDAGQAEAIDAGQPEAVVDAGAAPEAADAGQPPAVEDAGSAPEPKDAGTATAEPDAGPAPVADAGAAPAKPDVQTPVSTTQARLIITGSDGTKLTVYVDGRRVGTAPITSLLQPGRHTIKVKGEGVNKTWTPVLGPGETKKLVAPRAVVREMGTLSFNVPAGTVILLDGRLLGKAPLGKKKVPLGQHKVTLKSSKGRVTKTIKLSKSKRHYTIRL